MSKENRTTPADRIEDALLEAGYRGGHMAGPTRSALHSKYIWYGKGDKQFVVMYHGNPEGTYDLFQLVPGIYVDDDIALVKAR